METDINTTQYVAAKVFVMGGRQYTPGDTVSVEGLPDHKIGQLLNQRYLRPTPPVTDQDTA